MVSVEMERQIMNNQTILEGKYTTAKIFADEIDSESLGRLQTMVDMEQFKDCKIRVMPDISPTKGSIVGLTIRHPRSIAFPGLLGTDLYCGIKVVQLDVGKRPPDLNKLDKVIRNNIPAGVGQIRQEPHRFARHMDEFRGKITAPLDFNKSLRSIGSLGGGNHFIELDKDHKGNFYLSVHSGSRNFGADISRYWLDRAFREEDNDDLPYYLSPLRDPESIKLYIHDLKAAERFAENNVNAIINTICSEMKFKVKMQAYSLHNYPHYLVNGDCILRKGAVFSGTATAWSIIGLNMRDGLLLVKPKGEERDLINEWNNSFPHGAGRLYSRADTLQRFTVNQFKKEMNGIFSTSINKDTIDECPMAYKSSDKIIDRTEHLIRVCCRLKPVYNFKGGK